MPATPGAPRGPRAPGSDSLTEHGPSTQRHTEVRARGHSRAVVVLRVEIKAELKQRLGPFPLTVEVVVRTDPGQPRVRTGLCLRAYRAGAYLCT